MTDLAHDHLDLDGLLSTQGLELRDRVRRFVVERIKPNIDLVGALVGTGVMTTTMYETMRVETDDRVGAVALTGAGNRAFVAGDHTLHTGLAGEGTEAFLGKRAPQFEGR